APMVLTLLFAAIAVVLAVIGVYGVLAWTVARRTGEIGVRMALGARSADVLRMIMTQGARMILAGLVLGTAGALALGRVLASQIPEVAAFDALVLAAAVVALTAAALAASWLPARRAARVDRVTGATRELRPQRVEHAVERVIGAPQHDGVGLDGALRLEHLHQRLG
ncbi:MAG TPA: FtsX-like permease family protein, partial [Gammaproteobacteria bacterium]|nr:FtsX-like permease family protein [Gammaproteobacteria bacterium]